MGYSVVAELPERGGGGGNCHSVRDRCGGVGGDYFKMPLHYPKYRAEDYESMPEWKVDCLLSEYGLPVIGTADQKRKFAMGAFIWPHHSGSLTGA